MWFVLDSDILLGRLENRRFFPFCGTQFLPRHFCTFELKCMKKEFFWQSISLVSYLFGGFSDSVLPDILTLHVGFYLRKRRHAKLYQQASTLSAFKKYSLPVVPSKWCLSPYTHSWPVVSRSSTEFLHTVELNLFPRKSELGVLRLSGGFFLWSLVDLLNLIEVNCVFL